MNEYLPVKNQNFVTTLVNVGDASVMILQSIYYYYCRDWYYVHLFGVCGAFVAIAMVSIVPESPKFMYANNRFNEAREILKTVARWNKSKMSAKEIDLIVFDTENADYSTECDK